MEHIFITDLEFIDKEDVEYEDTLREYEESLRTGRSLKVGLYVSIYVIVIPWVVRLYVEIIHKL